MKPIALFALVALLCTLPAPTAVAASAAGPNGTPLFSEDFSAWQGSGFDSPPGPGQLDSSLWRVLGMSDGDGTFGGTHVGGDFGRGSSTGVASAGGAYAFDTGGGNIILGVQPTGPDFTPGSFDLRLQNNTGASIEALELSYRIWVRNDQSRANSLNLSWSLDDVNYTAVPELDFLTPEAADATPAWVATPRAATLTGFALAPGASIVLRWSSNDVSGAGGRDEFGIDDIQVSAAAAPALNLSVTGPAVALAGNDLVAAVQLDNPSDSDPLDAAVLTATLPTGISYASDSSGVTPTLAGNIVEWSFGTLAAQASIDFDLTLASDPGIAAGAVLTSEFELAADSLGSPVSTTASFATEFQTETLEIAEIQGEGARSPFAPATGNAPGQVVTTRDNIVTAVASNGFFIQTPDDRPSATLPLASRGLFVFTASVPAVQVGDRVDVTGAVVEFFDFTQISQPDNVSVLASSAALPQALELDAATPSPDPQNLSCGDTNFECFEGMRVRVANGLVTAPSQSFGTDPVAEAWISTDGARILRGPGEAFPGVNGCPSCPVWSGAPEIFEIDPDRFGLLSDPLAAGTRFTAEGVIGFSFGDYALWPTALQLLSSPTLPRPISAPEPQLLSIGSLNALNLFDDELGPARPIEVCSGGREAIDREVLTPAEYAIKLNKLAVYIIEGLRTPDVLAMQEVESVQTLLDLAGEIDLLSGVQYSAWLEPSNDVGNINNGYLVNEARVAVDSVTQLAGDECLSLDNSPLHDRAPLLLRGRFIAEGNNSPFAVFNNHLRSLGGIATSSRTRLKRHEQAQSTASLIQTLQTAEPDLAILAVGDFNAFQFSDGFVDPLNQIRGLADPAQNLVSLENAANPDFDDSNLTDPPLRLALNRLLEAERYSFIFRGVSQVLDHALLDRSAWAFFESLEYARGNADVWTGFESDIDTAARASDHDGFVVRLDPDRLFADGFEIDPL